MMSDQKAVHQEPVQLLVQGDGAFRTVKAAIVPEPPENCESQQLFDWAATVAIMRCPTVHISGQMRMVEVYATRWGLSTKEVDQFEPGPSLGPPGQ